MNVKQKVAISKRKEIVEELVDSKYDAIISNSLVITNTKTNEIKEFKNGGKYIHNQYGNIIVMAFSNETVICNINFESVKLDIYDFCQGIL